MPQDEQKLVHVIRHGQSTFNALYSEHGPDPMHFDARLTPLGEQQVDSTRETIREHHYDLVVTSPLTRAIQTTLGLFADRPRQRIIVESLHREHLFSSCDVGRSPGVLAQEFPHLDFDHLPDVWWHDHEERDERGIAVEPHATLLQRVESFRRWLHARPERSIAVIGHGTFFFHFAGFEMDNCAVRRWEPESG